MNATALSNLAPRALSVLRIVTGLIFVEHGTQKFLSFPAGDHAGSGLALANLGAALEVQSAIVLHPVRVGSVFAQPDAQQDVVRFMIVRIQKMRVVRRDNLQAQFIA